LFSCQRIPRVPRSASLACGLTSLECELSSLACELTSLECEHTSLACELTSLFVPCELTSLFAEDPEGAEEKLPPLADGWQQFYIRNLYGNIEDTFNRPIESSPDGWIDVTMRERTPNNGYFSRLRNTGSSRRCLNLGSYNYLGFGGVNFYCTPKVEEAMRNLPIALGSSSAELGHSQVSIVP
jgi:hypothetical protein